MRKAARIISKGQITAPREIRQALGVRPGDKLLFEKDRSAVRVRPVRAKSPFEEYRGSGTPGVPQGKKAVVRWVRELRGRRRLRLDSKVLIALWNEDESLNTLARSALDAALGRGSLVISAPVFAELARQL